MSFVKLDIVDDMVGAVADRRPFRDLLFGIHHPVRAVAQKKALLTVALCAGDDKLRAQLLEEVGGLQRALKIVADSHKADVEIVDAESAQKQLVGAVADLGVRNDIHRLVDPVLIMIDAQHVMAELVELDRDVFSESSESDQ